MLTNKNALDQVEKAQSIKVNQIHNTHSIKFGSEKRKYYEGTYTVMPRSSPVILETKQKIMRDDVTVFSIPTYKVSNDSGTTFYIGGLTVNGL